MISVKNIGLVVATITFGPVMAKITFGPMVAKIIFALVAAKNTFTTVEAKVRQKKPNCQIEVSIWNRNHASLI